MTSSPVARGDTRRQAAHAADEMLTFDEACALLRVSEGTLRYWRHLGVGPRSFKVGRHVRFWRTDLVEWLAEQTDASSGGH